MLESDRFGPAEVASLLDSGLEDEVHAALADRTVPRPARMRLARALEDAVGVAVPGGAVWPVASLVVASVPADAGERFPVRMESLMRALRDGGTAARVFGTDPAACVFGLDVPLLPRGSLWRSGSLWRTVARLAASGSSWEPESRAIGWQRIIGPPLSGRVCVAAAVVMAVRGGTGHPTVLDAGAVMEAWRGAEEDFARAGFRDVRVGVSCPRHVWAVPSDALMTAVSVAASLRRVAPGRVEAVAEQVTGREICSVRGERVVSVRCDALDVLVSVHFLDGDDLLGHPATRGDVVAAVGAGLVLGGEISVITSGGGRVLVPLPGRYRALVHGERTHH